MKLGLENKKEVVIAAIAVGFAMWYGFHQYTTGQSPSTASANTSGPNTPIRTTVRPRQQQQSTAVGAPTLDPRLRLDLLRSSEQIAYAGTGRNIFEDMAELPKTVTPVTTRKDEPKGPPRPPLPPPINLKFFGFANRPGEPKQIFLAKGEDVFIAKQGDIVDRQYKVVEIRNTEVVIQDLLNNNTQSIPLLAS
jgi:hypothetical protein